MLDNQGKRKVVGSIPVGANGIFLLHNPSGSTMDLGLTQPLKEMSTWDISCWLEVSIRKVLRPATSAQVILGFPVSISKC
jgi:hypothetical protein